MSGEEISYTETWFRRTGTRPDPAYTAVLSRDLQMSSLGNMHYQDLKHLHILIPGGFRANRKTHTSSYPAAGPSPDLMEISF